VELILYTHAHCSLCERLESLIAPHLDAIRPNTPVTVTKRDIADHPAWRDQYRTRIPVLTHEDRVILEGRSTPEEIAQALARIIQPSP